MKIKDLIKQSYEDLKNLTINWFNILMLVVIVFVLSNIITPIAYSCWTIRRRIFLKTS